MYGLRYRVRVRVAVTEAWRDAFPDACIGTLRLDGVANPTADGGLEQQLAQLLEELRRQYAGGDRASLLALPSIAAYQRHYRAFGQTYHVLRQVESVLLKGRPLAS